jgi:hypothetical protein
MLRQVDYVLNKLDWMREERIWPNGLRYLWTDAFGLILYVSLYHELREERWLDEAEQLVTDVERVLGRPRGLRIGEEPDRDGQYFHYLAMWLVALARLGDVNPEYRQRGIILAQDIHPAFVRPGRGVVWKMKEDLSGPYPGYGLGAMDAFNGYVAYRMLDQEALAAEIAEMADLIEASYEALDIDQDLGLGMMLWLAHFFPEERWAKVQQKRALATLDRMWVDPPGYFCRTSWSRETRFAFTNYGVSLGLQTVGRQLERVECLNSFFAEHVSGDEYERDAITHVMACTSRLPGMFLKQNT